MSYELSDDFLLSPTQAAAMLNTSVDTLERQVARGEGPPRVQISVRRHGFRCGDVRRHQAARERVSPAA